MNAHCDETRNVGKIRVEINCSKFIPSCIRQQIDVFQNDILNGEGVDVRKRVLKVNGLDVALVRRSIAKDIAHSCVRNRKEGFVARSSSDAFCESDDSNENCFWRWIVDVSSRKVGDVDEAEIMNFRVECHEGRRS